VPLAETPLLQERSAGHFAVLHKALNMSSQRPQLRPQLVKFKLLVVRIHHTLHGFDGIAEATPSTKAITYNREAFESHVKEVQLVIENTSETWKLRVARTQ
jgi:hypothetical protein